MSAESVRDAVSEVRGQHPLPQMSLFGYLIALPLLFVLLPLLPFLALYLAYGWVAARVAGPGTRVLTYGWFVDRIAGPQ